MSGILPQTLARNPLNMKISHLWKNGSLYWSVATQQWTPFLKVLRILHTTQKCWVHPLAPDVCKIDTNLGKFEKITTFWTRATSWAVRFQARNPTGISLVNTSYSIFLTVRFYWSHMRSCTPSWPSNKLYSVPLIRHSKNNTNTQSCFGSKRHESPLILSMISHKHRKSINIYFVVCKMQP